MPNFSTYKRMLNASGGTVGQAFKSQSDMVMERTWDNDLESKECYIYDYFHDDQPTLSQGMTYENTTKTKISLKFIQTQAGSLSKDEVDFMVQFKPSQKMSFNEGDELYYYETDYRQKYYAMFPLGMFIDIFDDTDKMYHKWLIVAKEESNQFVKYNVLKCNYYYHWIEVQGSKRIKRKMWGCRRSQSSYNSGIWGDNYFTTSQNQSIVWLPMNSITQKFYYNLGDTTKNMRIVMSSPGLEKPIVWQISKIETAQPIGINKITLYQTEWNSDTDYIDTEAITNGDLFAYYADYYGQEGSMVPEDEPTPADDISVDLTATSSAIKIGGSYKTITATIFNGTKDVTPAYLGATFNWSAMINNEEIDPSHIIWLASDVPNVIKVKLSKVRSYVGKVLTIQCKLDGQYIGEISLNIGAV